MFTVIYFAMCSERTTVGKCYVNWQDFLILHRCQGCKERLRTTLASIKKKKKKTVKGLG